MKIKMKMFWEKTTSEKFSSFAKWKCNQDYEVFVKWFILRQENAMIADTALAFALDLREKHFHFLFEFAVARSTRPRKIEISTAI